jgi:hypothetical protein
MLKRHRPLREVMEILGKEDAAATKS